MDVEHYEFYTVLVNLKSVGLCYTGSKVTCLSVYGFVRVSLEYTCSRASFCLLNRHFLHYLLNSTVVHWKLHSDYLELSVTCETWELLNLLLPGHFLFGLMKSHPTYARQYSTVFSNRLTGTPCRFLLHTEVFFFFLFTLDCCALPWILLSLLWSIKWWHI